MTLLRVHFYGNANYVGVILASGTLNLIDSAIVNNGPNMRGVSAYGPTLIINSTIANNSGGGMHVFSGTTTIINSTIANNTANVAAVFPGGGIRASGNVILINTIVAGNVHTTNPSTNNCGIYSGGSITSLGNNLASDNTCDSVFTDPGDLTSTDPLLGAVADNGGDVPTMMLGVGSPAIDAGDNAQLPADTFDLDGDSNTLETLPVDGRGAGFKRVNDGTVDIGAYESPDIAPTVVSNSLLASYTGTSPSSFTVTFSEDVNNAGGGAGTDDVTNPANYRGINKGGNGTLETASCVAALGGDDSQVLPSGVTYVPNTATVTFASPLPAGSYHLFICGTTSIVDLTGNHLNNGVDMNFDFTVNPAGSSGRGERGNGNNALTLPRTGFAPDVMTLLPSQPAELAYAELGYLWLEIPSLKIKANIVGVPQFENAWDVKWLGQDAGWLDGTAFPTWEGNSVITAHVTDANGKPGPFAELKSLKYGDQIIVHLFDEQYIFEIRNKRLVRPETTDFAFEHLEDHSYLTLITCQSYDPATDSYSLRRLVRAVLVGVK